jgi:8-oxo-dGTP diphosphatase
MKTYVLGFAFDEQKTQVLLVQKQKPKWQEGLLNGIGGKIKPNENACNAMYRECYEETNLILGWENKGFMSGINNDKSPFECHIFYAYDNKIFDFKQVEEEPLALHSPFVIIRPDYEGFIVPNLSFLIPFGLCKDHSNFITINY